MRVGTSRSPAPLANLDLIPRTFAGQSGTGRTTFVNTLCEQPIIEHQKPVAPEEAHLESGIRINPVQVGE